MRLEDVEVAHLAHEDRRRAVGVDVDDGRVVEAAAGGRRRARDFGQVRREALPGAPVRGRVRRSLVLVVELRVPAQHNHVRAVVGAPERGDDVGVLLDGVGDRQVARGGGGDVGGG